MTQEEELQKLAVRLWTAAESIDAIRGGKRVWWWAGGQVARLNEEGHLDVSGETRRVNLRAVEEVVEVLEDRLEMERGRRREVET